LDLFILAALGEVVDADHGGNQTWAGKSPNHGWRFRSLGKSSH
jgi:hypothetical protein